MLAPLVAVGPPLTPDDVERFSRHLLLAGFGEEAQRRVRNARVCVLGAGGLGSPAISYLVAAGVGTLGVVDDDVVALSNLQRQVLHRTEDVGTLKTLSAARAARALDPGVNVVLHDVRLTDANADEILRGYDLVLDGTDNFDTRYLVSDACARLGLPVVWASVLQMDAQVSVFWADAPDGRGVTLRDLFPEPPAPGSVPSCSQAGVLGAMCGQVGSLMATEAIKLVAGIGDVLLGRVLVIDALRSRWTEVPLVAAHGHRPDSPGSRGAVAAPAAAADLSGEITVCELRRRLDARAAGKDNIVVVDVRTTEEREIRTIPGSVHVPLDVLLTADGRALVPRDRDVVLFCAVGGRSAQALTLLRAAGWTRVAHLPGGMTVWPEA